MKNLSVAIIGAGKVGSAFAFSLNKKKVNIVAIVDKDLKKAKKLASSVKAKHFTTDVLEIPEETNLFIIAVQDRFIRDVSQNLSKAFSRFEGKFAFHTSGSLTSEELKELKNSGCNVFSLHPNFSFGSKKIKKALVDFNQCVFAIESDSKISVRFAIDFCKMMKWDYLILDKSQKSIYHSLAVILSNYTVTQFYQIEKYLGKKAVKSYLNLLLSTIQNIQNSGVKDALTGPILRGDVETVSKNLFALKNLNAELKSIYKNFGILTLELARDKIDNLTFQKLKQILSDEN